MSFGVIVTADTNTNEYTVMVPGYESTYQAQCVTYDGLSIGTVVELVDMNNTNPAQSLEYGPLRMLPNNGEYTYDPQAYWRVPVEFLFNNWQASFIRAYLFSSKFNPKWQRSCPLYRVGEVTEVVDTKYMKVDVQLPWHEESPINMKCRTDYMTCDTEVFSIGDSVVVKFEHSDLESPVVVGFWDDPKPCRTPVILVNYGLDYIVWDVLNDQLFELLDEDENVINQPTTLETINAASNLPLGSWSAIAATGTTLSGGSRVSSVDLTISGVTCDGFANCNCEQTFTPSDSKSATNPNISAMADDTVVGSRTAVYSCEWVSAPFCYNRSVMDNATVIFNERAASLGAGGAGAYSVGKTISYIKLPNTNERKYSWIELVQTGVLDYDFELEGTWNGSCTRVCSGTRDVDWTSVVNLHKLLTQNLEQICSNTEFNLRRTQLSDCYDAVIEMVVRGDNGMAYLNSINVLQDHPVDVDLKVGLITELGVAVASSAIDYEFAKHSFYIEFIDDDYDVTDNGVTYTRGGQLKIWVQTRRPTVNLELGEAGIEYAYDQFQELNVASILSYFPAGSEDYAYDFDLYYRLGE